MKQTHAQIPIRRTKLPPVRTLSAQDRAHAVEEMEMERKRVPTRRAKPQAADMDTADPAYIERLRRSMRGAINFARRRQAKKASPVVVDITLDELMEILDWQGYRCAISRLPFWFGSPVAYGPTIPSLDRIEASKGYTRSNVRVVLLGVNGLRGSGTNEDMLLCPSSNKERTEGDTDAQLARRRAKGVGQAARSSGEHIKKSAVCAVNPRL